MLTAKKPGGDEIVLLHVFASDADAHIVQGILQEHGIPTIIDNEIFSRIYPLPFSSVGGLRMMVRDCDYQQAMELLSTLKLD